MTRQDIFDGLEAAAADSRDAVARIRRDMDQQTLTARRLAPRVELLAVNLAIIEEGLKLLHEADAVADAPALRIVPGGRA